MGTLCAGADFKFLKPSYSSFVQCKMGQNYTKYCHVSSMLKYPVDSFNETAARREEIYGKTDFVLVVKGTHFQVHKEVLMKSSRYFETMLTLFDERLKSEVELKDIVEAPTMALTLHFIYEGHVTGVRKGYSINATSMIFYNWPSTSKCNSCKICVSNTFRIG